MRILFVCSKNSGRVAPFIEEQAESITRLGHDVDFFCIYGKGIGGYLKNLIPYIHKIKQFNPDIIHAHYGLSCLFANFQRKIPVVSTYHGSDINDKQVYRYSKIAIKLSRLNVFVSEKTMQKAAKSSKRNFRNVLIPCGVDTHLFVPVDKQEARQRMELDSEKKYVLFSGAFSIPVKNAELAKAAVTLLPGLDLIELKNYTRQQVVWLMNAVDAVLMTSHSEGSPQFIKEAMACNCPIVSVEVGDVSELIHGVEGCFLVDRNTDDIAIQLKKVLMNSQRTEGRKVIEERELDLMIVAEKIVQMYEEITGNKRSIFNDKSKFSSNIIYK